MGTSPIQSGEESEGEAAEKIEKNPDRTRPGARAAMDVSNMI